MVLVLLLGAVAAVSIGVIYQIVSTRADIRRWADSTTYVRLPSGPRLQVHRSGRGGPAVILEAGISATSVSWAYVQPLVAEFTEVCSYDRAGLGRSDAARGAVSAATNAARLHDLLAALDVPGPYVIVGHSYGTFIARAFAHHYREDVAGLVLVDPIDAAEWADPSPALQRRLRGGVMFSRIGGALAHVGFVRGVLSALTGRHPGVAGSVSKLFGPDVARTLDGIVGQIQKLPPDTWPIIQACWSQPRCFEAMARHLIGLPASARDVLNGSLGDIPTIVISGARGWAAHSGNHERLAELSSEGRVVVAAHSGHWIMLDEPGVVVDAIRDLVERHRSATRRDA